ncbi:metallophosphoesterase family protein [Caenimonas terrae]|uniref:Metallophosphoesterase family protein n=1 Tax=Caenimonas terrae TaxID=696074 RepID=A0ABW0NHA7_9BURK
MRWIGLFIAAALLAGCAAPPAGPGTAGIEALFTVQGGGGSAQVRVLTRAATCPQIAWQGRAREAMAVRAGPATIAARGGAGQPDTKPAQFDVLVCEAAWPPGVTAARIGAVAVPAPRAQVRRIAVIGDTGCRLKASDGAFQDCNDRDGWPLARVAASAAAMHPDLVVHVGDIHYRESPCPVGNGGCAGSPWGYGHDAWQADFFTPARPLLLQAPWVFVRGNHEMCARAGQGWFRFIDPLPWREQRSCNQPAFDGDADYSAPYAVALTPDEQLLVFDSAAAPFRAPAPGSAAFARYREQMVAVQALAARSAHNVFLSHHPLLAFVPGRAGAPPQPAGNAALQAVAADLYPGRLFPAGVDLSMHGHIHLFESIGLAGGQPVSLVLGNSASANEGAAPFPLPAGLQPYPGVVVRDYAARSEFGFAMLELQGGGSWLLTEYTADGQPVLRCAIGDGRSVCSPAPAEPPR